MRGLGFAPGPDLYPSYEGGGDFTSWGDWSDFPTEQWFPSDGGGYGGGVPVDFCFDDWSCRVIPILKQVVARTGRPCFAEWFGEVKGLDVNGGPITLGSDGHNLQTASMMLKQYAVGGIIYALWLNTVIRINPDGTTVQVGTYNLDTGTVTVSDGYQGGGYVTPGGGILYPPPSTGGIGGIDQNTLLLLAGGGLLLWAVMRKK